MPTRIIPFTFVKVTLAACTLLLGLSPAIASAAAHPARRAPVSESVRHLASRRPSPRLVRRFALLNPSHSERRHARESKLAASRHRSGRHLVLADVPRDHWAAVAIQGLMTRHLLVGEPGGKFGGDRPVTRYEMALVLYRMVKYMETDTAKKPVPMGGPDPVPYTPPGSHPAPPAQNNRSQDTGVRDAVPGNVSPVDWLIDNQYLTPDTPLADPPGSATVSPALLSDSLAYVVDRILLHRATPAEQERERQKAE